jgi:hypothetical protein
VPSPIGRLAIPSASMRGVNPAVMNPPERRLRTLTRMSWIHWRTLVTSVSGSPLANASTPIVPWRQKSPSNTSRFSTFQ